MSTPHATPALASLIRDPEGRIVLLIQGHGAVIVEPHEWSQMLAKPGQLFGCYHAPESMFTAPPEPPPRAG